MFLCNGRDNHHLYFYFFFIFLENKQQSALFSLVFPGIIPLKPLKTQNWKANFYRVFLPGQLSTKRVPLATAWGINSPKVFQPFGWRSKLTCQARLCGFTTGVPFLWSKATTKAPLFRNIFQFFREMESLM